MFKKISLAFTLAASLLSASSVEYGKGTFSMEGGFLGLSSQIDCDISTYTLKTEHSNIGKFYYGYNLSWYDSDTLRQAQKTYNSLAKDANGFLWNSIGGSKSATIPAMNYRIKGLDANLRLGYDIMHQDKDNYFGIGLLLGVSLPTIDANKGDSVAPDLGFMYNSAGTLLKAKDLFSKSKTEFTTYKIGPTLSFQRALVDKRLFLYATASYAYQNASIKNSLAKTELSADGIFQSYDIGLKFVPLQKELKTRLFTLNPSLYGTLGYRYSSWELKKVAIDTSGNEISSDLLKPLKHDFTMSISTAYLGFGYSF
ncbi:MAG TPA: hypothetical protein ENL00_04890 [Nitratifractor sp.]|nr:hypothetical protein [Nitratifractor sp.]